MFPEVTTHGSTLLYLIWTLRGKTNLRESEMENKKGGAFSVSFRVSEMCHIHHKAPRKEEGGNRD